MWTCDKCGKEFARRDSHKRHMNKTKPCVGNGNVKSEHTCKYCYRILSSQSSKYRHEKTCTVKKNKVKIDEIKEEKESKKQIVAMVDHIARLEDKLDKQAAQITKLMDVINDKNTIDVNYRSPYVQNNVIIINNIFEPDTSFITQEKAEQILDRHRADAPIVFTKEIYYGDHHSNHCLHIMNAKTKESMLFHNGDWKPLSHTQTLYYLECALAKGFDIAIKCGQLSERFKNDDIIRLMLQDAVSRQALSTGVNRLLVYALDYSKNTNVSYRYIAEDITRGKAAYAAIAID